MFFLNIKLPSMLESLLFVFRDLHMHCNLAIKLVPFYLKAIKMVMKKTILKAIKMVNEENHLLLNLFLVCVLGAEVVDVK